MPNTSAAKKSLRQDAKRRLRNRSERTALRNVLKKFRAAVDAGDRDTAEQVFRTVVKKLDQAASKGLIHKNAAARTKSRLSKAMPRRAEAAS